MEPLHGPCQVHLPVILAGIAGIMTWSIVQVGASVFADAGTTTTTVAIDTAPVVADDGFALIEGVVTTTWEGQAIDCLILDEVAWSDGAAISCDFTGGASSAETIVLGDTFVFQGRVYTLDRVTVRDVECITVTNVRERYTPGLSCDF